MRRKFRGQTFGGFKAAIVIRRESLARTSNSGQAYWSLKFHISILL
ncbi:hypothetical protein [uncultured Rhodoblastus sp.]|nr:hypothetical protein [uncultured Rhodoblastus sp.]